MSELTCQMTLWGVPIEPDNSNNLLGIGIGYCGEPASYWWNLSGEHKMPLCTKHALEGNKTIEPFKSIYNE